jgi:DNA-binding MarR family transcriptional regulator
LILYKILAEALGARYFPGRVMNVGVHSAGTKIMADTANSQNIDEFKRVYLGSLQLIERLHRRFLYVIKVELDRLSIQDINNIQSLILYNVGRAEMTVGELTSRGYYLGSNVSYNVKKMVENGYLEQERSPHDRRSIRLRLSPKGLELYEKINALYETHVVTLSRGPLGSDTLSGMNDALQTLERFWSDEISYGVSR